MKLYNINILKKNIIIIGSIISSLLFTTGCSNNSKSREEIEVEVYETYSDYNDIKLENSTGEYIPFVYIENGIYDENTFNKIINDSNINNFGLIVNPSNITYESIYKDIDVVKDIISKYKVGAPILYNLDYLSNPDYEVANIRLAEAFIDKLNKNGVYVGIIGNSNNLDLFKNKYKEYCSNTKINLDINELYMFDSSNNNLDFSNELKYIKDNKLNSDKNFIEDYNYMVKRGDSLYSISELYNIKVEDLVNYNNMSVDDTIMAGDIIKIPNVYYKQDERVEEFISFEDCMIGIDVSEYNCNPTGEKVVNEKLTTEITSKLGYEDLIRYSLGVEPSDLVTNDVVAFKENVYEHLDWNKIKENVDFVAIRIGDFWISKNNQVIFDEDEEFRYNIDYCINNNIPYFTYYVSDMTNNYTAIEETKIIISLLLSIDPNYKQPIYIDLEPYTDVAKNIYEYDKDYIDALKASLSLYTNNGFDTGIYSTENICNSIYKIDELNNYNLWSTCTRSFTELINYSDTEIETKMKEYGYYPSNYKKIIQLTCNGKSIIIPKSINGTFGSMDIDVADKSFVKKLKNN